MGSKLPMSDPALSLRQRQDQPVDRTYPCTQAGRGGPHACGREDQPASIVLRSLADAIRGLADDAVAAKIATTGLWASRSSRDRVV